MVPVESDDIAVVSGTLVSLTRILTDVINGSVAVGVTTDTRVVATVISGVPDVEFTGTVVNDVCVEVVEASG